MLASTPGKIQVLPEDVACRIAAGEVVERPASIVKELLDNSLDAGSTLITVEVEEGGRRLIRITDNGEGMNRTDARLSCQRFATSKLRHEEDLHHLRTLGFRGEALPSIASISRFRLRTISPEAPVGTETSSTGGIDWKIQDFAGSRGTEIEVRDVFFNTPGRLKFLKSVPTEFSKICQVGQQAAMVNPTVHFRLFHQGHKVFDYPAVPTMQDRLLQIYGPSFLERFLFLEERNPGFELTGYTISPHFARTARSPQEIFVNRRAIKNSTIAHAIQEAYGSFLPKGRLPQYVFYLTVDPESLDVNVHPTKREVRFSRPEVIHSGVRQAVRRLFFAAPSASPPIVVNHPDSRPTPSLHESPDTRNFGSAGPRPAPRPFSETPSTALQASGKSLSLFVQEPTMSYPGTRAAPTVNALGQIHQTYLLGQIGHDFYIVDQHTAHERVLFERLLRDWEYGAIVQQTLLIPETIDLSPHQQALMEEWLPTMAKAGIDIERFGHSTYLVRATPSTLGSQSASSLVLNLLEELAEWRSQDSLERTLRPLLATMACQSAVQAGRTMTLPEIRTLLEDWAKENYPLTCPHGRRIAVRHSLEELNALFARPTPADLE